MWERIRVMALCWIAAVFCIVFPGLAKEPRSSEDFLRRGIERYTSTDYDRAIEDFTNAIVVNSNLDKGAVKRIKHAKSNPYENESSDSSEKFLVIDDLNATAYFYRGNARTKKGDLRGAIQDFDKAIAFNPQNSWALNNRGYARHKTGDTDGAMRDYNRAIQMNPRNSLAFNNRGVLRYELRDLHGAIDDYTHAIEIDPQSAVSFNNRGNAYGAQGEPDRACRDFDRAIELDKNLLDAYLNRGLTLTHLGKDTEAEKDLSYYRQHAGDMKDTLEKLVQEARVSHSPRPR